PLDPAYPAGRLEHLVRDAAPKVIVSATGLDLPDTDVPVHRIDTLGPELATHPDTPPTPDIRPDHPAYVLYTSGSTGKPKGAVNTHEALTNRLLWMRDHLDLRPEDRVLHKTPIGFDVSVWELTWAFIAGARVVMAAPDGHRDPGYLIRTMADSAVTVTHFVPSMLRVFLDFLEEADGTGDTRPTALRSVVCSGEELPSALAERCHRTLPDTELHNLYGPTEAAIDVTAHHVTDIPASGRVPIGRPITGTQVHVLDGVQRVVPVG
ncbi:non-ribosomal peptide synthetase, partial [Streptomyces triticagri]